MIESNSVIFRTFRSGQKETIALFPYEVECRNECASYMHIGQHSSADYLGVMAATRPAKPEAVALLKEELESIGYESIKPILRRSQAKYKVAITEFNQRTY